MFTKCSTMLICFQLTITTYAAGFNYAREKRSPQETWSVTQLQFQKTDGNTNQPLVFWQPENVTTQGYVAKLLDFTQQQENTKLLQNFNNNAPVPNYTEGTSSYPESNPPNQQDKGNQDDRRSAGEHWDYNQNNTNSLYDGESAHQGEPPPSLWGPPHYRPWGSPAYGFWGPPPYRHWGPPPYRHWGPPPYGRWGPPPYGRWGPPPYGRWGPPPYGRWGPPSSHHDWGPSPPHRDWGPPPPHHGWVPPPPHHGWGALPPQRNPSSPSYNEGPSPDQRPQPDDNHQPTKPPYDSNQIHNRLLEQSGENSNYDNHDDSGKTAPLNDDGHKNRPGHGVPLLNDEIISEYRPQRTTQTLSHLFQAMPVRPES
ncbi:extensin-2-like isoform X2 [Hyposmocoma kahamanoa]|uniref:extensin-2-like isoform X2 n=1 Tax=Hyposmocoma kahamanoa TaxID=1477025 RepID=UPI000E6D85F3|nr:extensin-2-like isoform X2 [Hyposmocoma kahamanoa]